MGGGAPHDLPLSSDYKKLLDALVAAWDKARDVNHLFATAPLVVRDHFHEYLQHVPAAEDDPKLEPDMSEPGQG
jgi:hypothetical protein